MRSIKLILTVPALILASLTPFTVQSANATGPVSKTIGTLAVATRGTVFAETSYGAYGGYNIENGTYWYRDGQPYSGSFEGGPGSDWNLGGWGFSGSSLYGTYHPGNCSGFSDVSGLCFSNGDANRSLSFLCGWWSPSGQTCLNIYRYYWSRGQRGVIQSGGQLNGQYVNSPEVFRYFFEADNPAYYPSGPQHDVPLSTIYKGGWSLCWSGTYDDLRTVVADIQQDCNGAYTMMAGSYFDSTVTKPTISKSSLVAVNDNVVAELTLQNPDNLSISKFEATLTDLQSGKSFSCVDQSQGMDLAESKVNCAFPGSQLGHRYDLSVNLQSELFNDNLPLISNQLVINNDFQVVPESEIGLPAKVTNVCAYHAAPRKIVALKVGRQTMNTLTDDSGYGCSSFLLPEKPGRQLLKATFGRISTKLNYLYMPDVKFSFRGGPKPKVQLDARSLPANAQITVSKISRSTQVKEERKQSTLTPMSAARVAMDLARKSEVFDLRVQVNGIDFLTSVLTIGDLASQGNITNQ